MYNKLDKTQDFPVTDGFVSFTRTFRYLGSLISYTLRDDNDITSRLAAANASMGKLKEVWRNPHRCIQQISSISCHSNEPPPVGSRDLVIKEITT